MAYQKKKDIEDKNNNTDMEIDQHIRQTRKKMANFNERKRTLEINTNLEKLKKLIQFDDNKYITKSGILKLTAGYIEQLKNENKLLLSQIEYLKGLVQQMVANGCTSEEIDAQHNVSSICNLTGRRDQLDRERRRVEFEHMRSFESKVCTDPNMSTTRNQQMCNDEFHKSFNSNYSTAIAIKDTISSFNSSSYIGSDVISSPEPEPQVLMKVETLPTMKSVSSTQEDTQSLVYLASTSTQNLETLVEAIQHLREDD